MTTSSNPTPTTTESEDSSSELSRIWRAIGVLQGTVATLVEGQRQLMEGQRELRSDLDLGLREVNRRIDRMFYAILGVGGALLVAMFASRFVGS